MKTTVLFRMMVLVAMVVAGIANTELKAQDNNFITNEEKVDDKIISGFYAKKTPAVSFAEHCGCLG